MINNLMNQQIQATLFQLLSKWLEKSMDSSAGANSEQDLSTLFQSTSGASTYTGSYSGLSGSNSSFDEIIQETAKKHGVDPSLVRAVVQAESNFNPNAVSSAGAKGLMQLMPGTASSLGVRNSFDPEQNVEGGTKLLRSLLDRYDGNTSLALAAYNAGPGAVSKYGGIPPYKETQVYVNRVMSLWKSGGDWRA
jgi:soluble lytic murein transglycosylase-like protein